jgi:hypothetical protein
VLGKLLSPQNAAFDLEKRALHLRVAQGGGGQRIRLIGSDLGAGRGGILYRAEQQVGVGFVADGLDQAPPRHALAIRTNASTGSALGPGSARRILLGAHWSLAKACRASAAARGGGGADRYGSTPAARFHLCRYRQTVSGKTVSCDEDPSDRSRSSSMATMAMSSPLGAQYCETT